jgi:hypothetical protein
MVQGLHAGVGASSGTGPHGLVVVERQAAAGSRQLACSEALIGEGVDTHNVWGFKSQIGALWWAEWWAGFISGWFLGCGIVCVLG